MSLILACRPLPLLAVVIDEKCDISLCALRNGVALDELSTAGTGLTYIAAFSGQQSSFHRPYMPLSHVDA